MIVIGTAILGAARVAAPPRITIDTGTLEGVDTAGVMVFRGIPYAAPPVGEFRWRPPQPPKSWTGVRPANQLGHNCIQHQPYGDIDPFAAGVSEDCLFLNVWTNSLDTRASRRPVLVWIHGGGFWAGFGGEERHNGAPLARRGAVVVTLNYRLGAFGFLAHPALAADAPPFGVKSHCISASQFPRRLGQHIEHDGARVALGEDIAALALP